MFFELRGGTNVLIRPIEPADKPRLEEGLRRLSNETIRKRFLAAKPRFSRSELRYLTQAYATQEHKDAVAAFLERR